MQLDAITRPTSGPPHSNRRASWTLRWVVGCVVAWAASGAGAATLTVTNPNDDGSGTLNDTLSYAIMNAADGDVIDIQTNIALSNSLPEITNSITIQTTGGPFTIDGNGNQIFTVSQGTSTIRDLILVDGLARGGDGTDGNGGGGGGLGGGGALYIGTNVPNGTTVTIENVVFQNNQAVGGDGGNGDGSSANGGNGGGYNANADSSTAGTGGATGGPGDGADGGYGGGGAGAGAGGTTGGTGNGGGDGGAPGVGGGGGLALGGAVFVANGSTLNIVGSTTGIDSNNSVTGGTGGTGTSSNGANGTANGAGLYVGIGSEATIDNSGGDITVTGNIYSNGHITINGTATGTVTFLGTNFNSSLGTGMTVATGTLAGTTSSLQGPITNSAILRFNQNTTGTFSGNIVGSGGVFVDGGGTVIFSSTNSYTGNTTVIAGTTLEGNTLGLQGTIQNDSTVRFNQNLNGTFNGTIAGTGDVIITGTGTVTFTNPNSYTGATTIAGGRLQGTTSTILGDIANNGDLIFNQNVTGTYGDVISGTGRVNFAAGSSLVVFTQAQTYSGGTTVNSGAAWQGNTDSIQGNVLNRGVITFSQAADGTYGGNMSGTGAVNLNSTGTIAFTGSNSYSGGTTVAAGTWEGDTNAIQGNVLNNSNVIFNQNFDGTYAGSMSGTGGVKLVDSGRVVFSGTNSYSGNTTVEAGTLEGTTFSLQGNIDNGAEVDFNQNFNGTFNGVIAGAGSLVKSGTGNVSLVGTHTYAGDTTITGGKLSVNGTITSPVFIDAGGALGGTGTINGDVNNTGIIAPGNSIGTLHINGTYTSAAGSQQQIEVDNAGTVAGVNNDLIDVTGNIVLNGGTVAVQTTTSIGFAAGSRYTFLQYTGTRTGTFDGITVNSPFLTATLDYDDPNMHVDFLLFRNQTTYSSVAQTFNQSQVASYLDQNSTSASGDFATVLDQVNLLSASQARNAFDQMSGPIYGTAPRVLLFNTTYMMLQIQRNSNFEGVFGTARDDYGLPIADDGSVEPSPEIVLVGYSQSNDRLITPVYRVAQRYRPVWNAWTTGYGSIDSGSTQIRDYGAAGSIVSLYRYFNPIVKFGVFGAYNYVGFGQNFPNQTNRMHDAQLGTYLRADDGELHCLLAHSAGFDSYDSSRRIQFGAIDREARGSYDGWQTTVYGEAGKRFYVYPLDIEPFLGMQYSYVRQNAFTETGADSLNLAVDGTDTNVLYGVLGSRMLYDWVGGVMEFRSAWLHNLLHDTTVLDATFASVGGAPFAAQGLSFGHNAGLLGGGVNWNLTERLNIAGNYDAFLTNDAIFHVGSGSVQYRW